MSVELSRREFLGGSFAAALMVGGARDATQPSGAQASHVEIVGYCDLDDRPAFKMAIREVHGRWYLYTGHTWHSGWTVVDVTDPARAEVAAFVPGPANTWTLQVDLHGETMVTALEKPFENFGGKPGEPFEAGFYVWDIADPAKPKRLSHHRTGGTGTHRNLYPGGRYVHVAAGAEGFDGNIYTIVDIADRRAPREVGRWWHPDQKRTHAAPATPQTATATFDGSVCRHDVEVSHHGPAYPIGNLVYLPYGGAGLIVLDIKDVTRPRVVSQLDFSPPFHDRLGVHGVLPVPERGLAFVNSENVTYAEGPAHHASIVDIRDPAKPFLLSILPEPVPPAGASYADFTTRGGWRGPHNINHHQHHPDVQRQGNLLYVAHFNAGLRIYDVSNPRLAREAGWFLPPDPTKRYGPMPEGRLIVQTEDVVVDRRGYIYISEKNQGVWILRYTGPAPPNRASSRGR